MGWEDIGFSYRLVGLVMLGGLTVIDLKNKRIPVIFPVIFGCLGFVLRGGSMFFDTVMGMVPGAIVVIVSLISQGQIGMGDGILILFTGGVLGVAESVEVFILSLISVCLFSSIGLVLKKFSKKTVLPYVPFYFTAYLGVVCL